MPVNRSSESDELVVAGQAQGDIVNPRNVRLAAMDLLARRDHLQGELQLKLKRRFPGDAPVLDVLHELQEEGLQSDERFCESYVRQRAGRGYGPERIRMELRQKGAAEDLVLVAIKNCEVDWVLLARDTRYKKFGAAIPAAFKEKARQLRFLQYRGFSGESVARALRADDD